MIGFIAGNLWSNRKRIKITIQSLFKYNKEIRISCAYIFRIKSEDKYILIKGNRIDQYQPVGGVYKYFDSFKSIKEELEVTDEQEPNFYEDNDLRIRTKGRYVLGFLDWFDSRKNREVSVNREIFEEIGFNNNDFDGELIKEVKIEFIKQIKESISYSKHFSIDEIKIFDVFDLEIPHNQLQKIIEREDIILVGKKDIEEECVCIEGKSRKIAMTAGYIL